MKDDWAVGNAGDGTPGVHTEAKAALLVQNSREKRMAEGAGGVGVGAGTPCASFILSTLWCMLTVIVSQRHELPIGLPETCQ